MCKDQSTAIHKLSAISKEFTKIDTSLQQVKKNPHSMKLFNVTLILVIFLVSRAKKTNSQIIPGISFLLLYIDSFQS